jgi:DNA-binding MarR family transcriptional regulator
MKKEYITGRGRQKDRVQSRDLVCYWSAIELGIFLAELAKRLGLTIAAVSCAVKRGGETAKAGDYRLDG